jgi:DNA-binding transcriptional ArsR family regulator
MAIIAADPFARGLVSLISATKWIPAYVAVPPAGGMRTALEEELLAVEQAPDEFVQDELARSCEHSWRDADLGFLHGRHWGARTAALLRRMWDECLAVDWDRRRILLERDVTYRAGLLAVHGWPSALHRMSRRSEWVGTNAIRFGNQAAPDRVVGDEGMLFVPVSASSGSWLCQAPPNRHALVYPARGYATEPHRKTEGALEHLVGVNRSAILTELEQPATSTELAAVLKLSLGTIGGHLAVLRNVGLVLGTRVGRRVVYRRTAMADLLLAGNDT